MLWLSSPAHQRRKLFCFPNLCLISPTCPHPTVISSDPKSPSRACFELFQRSFLLCPFLLDGPSCCGRLCCLAVENWKEEAGPWEGHSWGRRNSPSTCMATRQEGTKLRALLPLPPAKAVTAPSSEPGLAQKLTRLTESDWKASSAF